MLKSYKKHVDERAKQGIPPLPLDADQTSKLVDLLKSEQIRSIKQLIDYEQLYETNTDVNEHWNSIRRQLDNS